MYQAVPQVILFREEHSRRVLVPKVEFISAAGKPAALVTGKAVFGWDGRFVLKSFHPGESVESIRAATGFAFGVDASVMETARPSDDDLARLRGVVGKRIAADYPDFAKRIWNIN
jgi:glutaconate CoA-transferase, subunit B